MSPMSEYGYMLAANLRALFLLYYRPGAAMSRILDEGSVLFGLCCVLAISIAGLLPGAQMSSAQPFLFVQGEQAVLGRTLSDPGALIRALLTLSPFGILTGPLLLVVAYVPCAIVVMHLVDRRRGLGQKIYSEFAPLLACTSLAWTAANLPAVLLRAAVPQMTIASNAAAYLYFAILMVFAFRSIFGASYGASLLVSATAWLGPAFGLLGYEVTGTVVAFLASPFFLVCGYRLFQGDLHALASGLRSRQAFRRHLEASTINPNDAEAHYQLGLIYMERRRVAEAAQRFEAAARIDKTEAGPLYQLGLIARDAGQKAKALQFFETAATLDPGHNSHEALRELGAAYKVLDRHQEAQPILEKYVAKRPYDPEGLFHLGESCEMTGQVEKARDLYRNCIEAAQTAPHFRRAMLKPWLKSAANRLRGLNTMAAGA